MEFFSLACGWCNLDYGLVGELNTWLESCGVSVYSIELESPDSVREGRSKSARGILIPSDHPVVSLFNVNYVPRNFILDPTGRILRKDIPAAEARAVWESMLSAGKTATEAR